VPRGSLRPYCRFSTPVITSIILKVLKTAIFMIRYHISQNNYTVRSAVIYEQSRGAFLSIARHSNTDRNILSIAVIFLPQVEDETGGPCSTYGEEEERVQIIGGKAKGKRPLGRPRRRWVNNIRMDLGEVGLGCCGLDWSGSG
jgi:hypothetical protein